MDRTFLEAVQEAHEGMRCLLVGVTRPTSLEQGVPGVYLFSEGLTHLYIGRSQNVRQRYSNHTCPGQTYKNATFAMALARDVTGRHNKGWTGFDRRLDLMQDEFFRTELVRQVERIRAMEFRFVLEPDPERRQLLELYCVRVLRPRHNEIGR